ncbi:DNA transformation protein [Vibrio astriarenae]|uniref:DNA transformation protein n=1 Tax=Vibrio astriarenae TaxID=1481923 RepID=A0A7Z2T3Q0_9VIBR|nr:TfoX/Sxy family DNA transformation protein [Vibrio astriarenae]QIA63682.1 DNA transformation protein [Vibrio astriarenae]
MTDQVFLDYVSNFGKFQQRAMFGGTGIFKQGAMFCQFISGRFYLRGGGKLDARLNALNCVKYRQVKRQCTATVNYYDVTALFIKGSEELNSLMRKSIALAVEQKNGRQLGTDLRIRDLPNMQLTIERMLRKSGIEDVDTFKDLGAHEVFEMVKGTYGNNVDPKLLWKLAGAIEGVHWKVLKENKTFNQRVEHY